MQPATSSGLILECLKNINIITVVLILLDTFKYNKIHIGNRRQASLPLIAIKSL